MDSGRIGEKVQITNENREIENKFKVERNVGSRCSSMQEKLRYLTDQQDHYKRRIVY